MVWVSGQQLQNGKYTIDKRLSNGGFGITYLAKDKKGDPVVIKTLKYTDVNSDDFDKCLQDFINEAIKLAKCNHPHIVKVYECIKDGDIWGMVMEYIEGGELENLGVLSEQESLLYIQQIGEALTVVHNNGLLHRDVKPRNILVRDKKSEAVLIDFGIARDFTPNLTQTHTAYITDFYAPPEQYDPRAKRGAFTDVYSLAATLYKVLTGNEPESAISRMRGEPLALPNELNPNISDRVNQAILKALELQPENRPQSVQEWLEMLKAPEQIFSSLANFSNYSLSNNVLFEEIVKRDDSIKSFDYVIANPPYNMIDNTNSWWRSKEEFELSFTGFLFSHFTNESLRVIQLAYQETYLGEHKFIGSESILLGLISANTGLAATALNNNGVTLENVRLEVEKIFGTSSDILIKRARFTPRIIKFLKLSQQVSIRMRNKLIYPEHLLLALLSEGESVAIQVLNNLGVELSKLENFILENIEP